MINNNISSITPQAGASVAGPAHSSKKDPFSGMTGDNVKLSGKDSSLSNIDPKKARELIFSHKISGIETAWTFQPPRPRITSVSFLDDSKKDLLVISHDKNKFYCSLTSVNADTGKVNWESEISDSIEGNPVKGNDGTLYLQAFMGKSYSLDPATGKTEILVDPQRKGATEALVMPDGTVINGYSTSGSSSLKAVDAKTKQVKWEINPGLPNHTKPLQDSDGNVYFEIIDDTFTLASLDGKTGQTRWMLKDNRGLDPQATISVDKTLYIQNNEKQIKAIDTQNGKEKWKFQQETRCTVLAADEKSSLYGADWDANLFKLDHDSGEKLWEVPVGKIVKNIKFGRNNNILLASREQLVSIDSKSGKILWSKPHNGGESDNIVEIDDKGGIYSAGAGLTAFKPAIDLASEEIDKDTSENEKPPEIKQGDDYIDFNGVRLPRKKK